MSELPFYLAAFALVIGVLVVFHELGHYLAARWCGVKVLRFSVGFGRVLWQRRFGADGTEWAVSVIPLGGYVKMLDEREGDVAPAEAQRAFNRQTVGRRSLIVAAGPLANFLLAILLYWGIFMYGSDELLPLLGQPPAGTPAAVASIQAGEQVRSIDGEPVQTWNDLRWQVLQKATVEDEAVLEVINARGEIAIRRLALAAAAEDGWEGDALERLGLRFYRPDLPPVIGRVMDGPAQHAGIQLGDRVVAIDGRAIASWHELVMAIRDAGGRQLRLELLRQTENFTVDLVPEVFSEAGKRIGKIGIGVAETGESRRPLRTFVSYGPVESAVKAVRETWDKSVFSLLMLGKMLTGEVSLKNLSGPVTIADYAGQSARLGFDYYVKFMALVSISLGVLNLLPIPVLDGGHLMYHMIEVVRRKPLSERAMAIGQQLGLAILFTLMAFAFFNDLNRLFGG
ncbi:RIP metalloprotease RseP [Azonexus fungiphilus]|uniref:RIP metalloprotease RseP n=1 Tax=Azonexus fungiphilus TaxID=146940 RepID=UPI00156AE3D3|nr:RIP metalloprotease RseP [Azonexus fungiphilus]